MVKVKKLILVTAPHLPQHKYFRRILYEASKKLGVGQEIKREDYVFLNEYGEKDEFGMAWAPQLFAELDDGRIEGILSRLPIDPQTLNIDVEKALKQVYDKLRELGVEV